MSQKEGILGLGAPKSGSRSGLAIITLSDALRSSVAPTTLGSEIPEPQRSFHQGTVSVPLNFTFWPPINHFSDPWAKRPAGKEYSQQPGQQTDPYQPIKMRLLLYHEGRGKFVWHW